MERLFEKDLMAWKTSGMEKPLMVVGVRQIGKTYTINKFCEDNFDEYINIDLSKNEDVRSIFNETIDPDKVIAEIEIRLRKKINSDKCVLFFDEVQVSEKFIESLKYFCESEKPYKIICAGSLLGVKINRFNASFPVGKVRVLDMYPMNFEEYLMACGEELLINKILSCYKDFTPMPSDLHKYSLDLYRKYLCVGGMPEAVKDFVNNGRDILLFDRSIIEVISMAYLSDMTKYTFNKAETTKIEKVYKSIAGELAKEKRRFKYSGIEQGGSKRKYESSIDWLSASRMVHISNYVKKIEKPLNVYKSNDVFKLYLSDVGLLSSVSGIDFSDVVLDDSFMFKGALAENYVACEFVNMQMPLFFWTSDRKAEVDFLISNEDGIIPVEVKASVGKNSPSLRCYIEKYKPKYSIRISARNFGYENQIKSIPLYAIFCMAAR